MASNIKDLLLVKLLDTLKKETKIGPTDDERNLAVMIDNIQFNEKHKLTFINELNEIIGKNIPEPPNIYKPFMTFITTRGVYGYNNNEIIITIQGNSRRTLRINGSLGFIYQGSGYMLASEADICNFINRVHLTPSVAKLVLSELQKEGLK